ncbi:LamG-like jellyroll fold domain-containing protein [Lentzea sp. NPDC005914]|uniref:LamG-like jellyroll fold domain-containing protein n=1 Tax=Lentzea sp. NPDC005914 TaxID=3154572 RepID=UPI003404A2DD
MRALLAMSAAVMSLCLTAGAVQADAPLASDWRFDEASGTTTVDAVTGASGALSGNVAFGPGKAGSGLVFNGGTVSAPLAIDAARSFTVSAWVNLPAKCATRTCKFTAVSGDGVRSSRFSLGYARSRDLLGNWFFEMAESDTDQAPITSTAVSAELSEAGEWTHLVGTYDAETHQTVLYAHGNRVGAGRVNAQWSGAGTFTVGAGAQGGCGDGVLPRLGRRGPVLRQGTRHGRGVRALPQREVTGDRQDRVVGLRRSRRPDRPTAHRGPGTLPRRVGGEVDRQVPG